MRAVSRAALATIVGLAATACLSSANLSGAPADDTPLPPACAADVQNDVGNCGTCGHVCPNAENAFGTCKAGACAVGCNTGYADCDGDPTNGCEVMLGADPANCGQCGKSCGGGACAAGLCDPVLLTSLPGGSPGGLALDETSVYVAFASGTTTTNTAILKLPKTGGTPTTVVPSSGGGAGISYYAPQWLAVDGSKIFWIRDAFDTSGATDTWNVVSAPLAGGAVSVVASGLASNRGRVRVAGGSVYWITDDQGGTPEVPSKIQRCSETASNASPTTIDASVSNGQDIAIDGATLYYSTAQGAGLFDCTTAGNTCAGSAVQGAPSGSTGLLGVDADSVLVASSSSVGALSKTTHAYTAVATSQGYVQDIVSDGQTIYWIEESFGVLGLNDTITLFSCPKAGCDDAPRAVPLRSTPVHLAVDGTALYILAYAQSAAVLYRMIK